MFQRIGAAGTEFSAAVSRCSRPAPPRSARRASPTSGNHVYVAWLQDAYGTREAHVRDRGEPRRRPHVRRRR